MTRLPRSRIPRALLPEWRPEIRFLLEQLGATGLSHPGSSRDVAPGGLDWDYLLGAATRHGVLPLLFKALSSPDSVLIPDAVMGRMRRGYGTISRRNFILTQELLRLLTCLDDHGIVAVPYKGVLLAAIAYGDPSLRQFADLDILIRRKDVLKAKLLLQEQGYSARFIYGYRPLTRLSSAETDAFLKNYLEFEMQRKDGLLIDLHWQFAPRHYPFRLDPDPLLARLETFRIEGQSVSSFAREDQVLVLCLHGAKDRWEKLLWMIDLAKLIEACPDLDWASMCTRSTDSAMELPLLLGLSLAETLFPGTVPRSVTERSAHRERLGRMTRSVFGALFKQRPGRECLPVNSLHLQLCANWSDKVTYLARGLCVPRVQEWSMIRLPDWLYPLYYVIRPIRIMARCARVSIERLQIALGRHAG